MGQSINKPFYFRPPWNILFDLQMLEKMNPWDVNLSYLLLSFLEEMKKQTEVDFRASGMALGTSATIHFMKSELLLKMEEPPSPPEPSPDFVPPPLILPLRYELTTTTIQNLLEALDNALKTEKIFALKLPSKEVMLPPAELVPSLSAYLMEMEDQMERLLVKMRTIAEKGHIIILSRILTNLKKLEQIRDFIILLFLAHKNRVTLWQEEGSDEIFITVNGD